MLLCLESCSKRTWWLGDQHQILYCGKWKLTLWWLGKESDELFDPPCRATGQLVTRHKLFLGKVREITSIDLALVGEFNVLALEAIFLLVGFEKQFHMFPIPLLEI